MTRKRNDSHSTEFGLWLRDQREIDSGIGFIATNIDFMWSNYKTGQWMIIEEKRYKSDPSRSQRGQFNQLHGACLGADGYCGLHLIQFENTSPEDGLIWLDRKEITRDELVRFLQTFEAPDA